MKTNHDASQDKLATLFELEKNLRNAPSLKSLEFIIANETGNLIPCDQVALLTFPPSGKAPRVKSVSGMAAPDTTSPFIHWVEKTAALENHGPERLSPHALSWEELPRDCIEERDRLSPPHVFWLPLISPVHGLLGILWLARHPNWNNPSEQTLLDHLGLSYAHALQGFHNRPTPLPLGRWLTRPSLSIVLAALACLAMFFPVTLSVLGQARVVPLDAFVLTSPVQGVVERVLVQPNQPVVPGQILARLDDTEMQNQVQVSAKTLEVAMAQLKRAERASFSDADNREALAELEARTDLCRAELDYAQDRLEKSILRAEKNGVAVLSRPDHWQGRPVSPGEAILQVADPSKVEIEIMLPVKDALVLQPGNRVRLFLDQDPLSSLEGRILRFEYDPRPTDRGDLAYVVTAALDPGSPSPRLGLTGTAKVYGESVTLFYYLFRRPITSLRQWWGI
ncbi:MAG: HlyD family efflux transporter periplasmic adaptor subunit [Desulfobacterales bacterium]|nr:HlyD family efflux transporter periplasmic adaptor subunit [Desulfobacterales bacterium]